MMRNLPYDRAERVADEIFRIVSQTLFSELSDPRLSGTQITRVRMTKDLQIARIYFHLNDDSQKLEDRVKKGLESAAGFFKRKVASELSLKFTPELEFFYDEALDLTNKIDSLFEGRRPDEH